MNLVLYDERYYLRGKVIIVILLINGGRSAKYNLIKRGNTMVKRLLAMAMFLISVICIAGCGENSDGDRADGEYQKVKLIDRKSVV